MAAFETVASSPLILDNIFMSINLFDLYKARCVCKMWKAAADAEIRKRRITSKVDCTTISLPVDKERDQVDTVKLFKKKFDAWKQSWESSPTVLMVSLSFTFEFEMKANWVPDDCTCVAIESSPVCVDGVHIETEDDGQDDFESCNLVAFHSLGKASVIASMSSHDTKGFFSDLHNALVQPTLKFLIVFVHHDELDQLLEKADKAVDAASKRGVVILCYASYTCPMVANFQGHQNLSSGLVAVGFKGEDILATSLFSAECGECSINELVGIWKKIDFARKRFVETCPNHEMNGTGYCVNCKSQTLGFLMSPSHHLQYGYEQYDDDIRPLCFNQEQDAFRFVIHNVPLVGWLGDQFITCSNVNVDAKPIETKVLHPVDDVNFIFALLVLR